MSGPKSRLRHGLPGLASSATGRGHRRASPLVRCLLTALFGLAVAGCIVPPPRYGTPVPRTPLPTPGATATGVHVPVPQGVSRPGLAASDFHANCSQCHGDAGRGDGPTAELLPGRLPDFTDRRAVAEQSPAEYFAAISRGVPGTPMLRWDHRYTAAQRWDLAFYVWSLSVPASGLDRGGALYVARCARCHGRGGSDPAVPRLNDPLRVYNSRAQTSQKVADAHPGLWASLGDDERVDLVEFTWTFLYVPVRDAKEP